MRVSPRADLVGVFPRFMEGDAEISLGHFDAAIAAGCSRATRFAPEGEVMRLQGQTATIENGFVWLPERAPWLADYLADLRRFRRRE